MKRGAPDREPVLIVDDDELVRWSAAEGLRECGYNVEVAANAREALERCPGTAVALLNHDHPRVDGLALADTVRRYCPRCAVVLMAADLTSELRRHARERSIARVLAKPFSLEDLVHAIDHAVGRSLASSTPRPAPGGATADEARQTGAPHGV